MNILLYNLLLPVAFLLYLPVFTVKLIRRGGFRRHFGERFGLYGAGQKAALRGLDRPVWIHAVSVGEAVAAVAGSSAIPPWGLCCPPRPPPDTPSPRGSCRPASP
ncbi:MAG: 3-deoxy-D-manno-octulosonic-acid transferase [Lentisphaerae bacterium ADurb.BinA184]|nr:MAG: 3-deoxy-D-manno-octulosonic-acid transferase [Lentisphaerae bacterium ADurb.BinA184]